MYERKIVRPVPYFPRAMGLISGLSRNGILDWLQNYETGQVAMRALEEKLARERRQ